MKRSTIVKSALTVAVFALGKNPSLAKHDTNANLAAAIRLAQKEGELNILQSSFGDPQMWGKIQTAVNAKYHLDVRLNGRPGPSSASLAPRLIDEVRAGRKPSSDITLNPPSSRPSSTTRKRCFG